MTVDTTRRALLSVYDKRLIVPFAERLSRMGWELMASGGTAKAITDANIPVTDIAGIVGEPILGHRVVTLSREIHAGLLSKYDDADDIELARHRIRRIDLVCVNLYPLEEEIRSKGATRESVIEKTDIGGPAMLRSAAKGRRYVLTSPDLYEPFCAWLEMGEPKSDEVAEEMAAVAELTTGLYALRSFGYTYPFQPALDLNFLFPEGDPTSRLLNRLLRLVVPPPIPHEVHLV